MSKACTGRVPVEAKVGRASCDKATIHMPAFWIRR
jgi:hypothetical protein